MLNSLPGAPPTQVRLDDLISPEKVACGPDGVTHGALSMLPAQWLLAITSLFNAVFISGMYLVSWMRAKMFIVFKRGSRSVVDNYRELV